MCFCVQFGLYKCDDICVNINKIKMDSTRKSKTFMKPRPLKAQRRVCTSPRAACGFFMGMDHIELKNCIVSFQSLSEENQISGSTKYLSVKLFLNFFLQNPFYDGQDVDLVMFCCFWTAFKTLQPAHIQEVHSQQGIAQALNFLVEENQVEEFVSQFLVPLQDLCSEPTPYQILDKVAQFSGCSSSFSFLVKSILDYSILEPQAVLLPPQTLFASCFLASYRNGKEKPQLLADYAKHIETELPEAVAFSSDILETIHQLSKSEGESDEE